MANKKQFVSVNNYNSTIQTIFTGVPQGSVLGPLLFLVYINDLHNCIKYSRTYHFADDTNILCSDKSLYTLANKVNRDLKNLCQWLKANRLSLNVKKNELIIFRQKKKPLNYSVKLKLNGKRLFPTSSVKYLGVFLDQHLYWNKQLAHFIAKLNQGIGILSKLRRSTNLKILKIVYHPLVGSHLHYSAQLWGQTNAENINKIRVLQNQVLKKITFKKLHDSTNEIYKNLKILRFSDSVCIQTCLFMNQIE